MITPAWILRTPQALVELRSIADAEAALERFEGAEGCAVVLVASRTLLARLRAAAAPLA